MINIDKKRKQDCQAKNTYSDEILARAIAQERCKIANLHMLWVYKCDLCNKWHLTSTKKHGRIPVTKEDSYFDLPTKYNAHNFGKVKFQTLVIE